jgi:hypothetical protein
MAIARDTLQKKHLRFPDSEVIYDHDFLTGPDLYGFEQLYSGTYEPPIGWDRKGMWVGIENAANQIGTAIKRQSHHERFNKITVEAWLSLAQHYGDANIRSVEIGIDQADNAGFRNYYALRRVFTKTSGAGSPTARFDLKTGSEATPAYAPAPGQGVPMTPITGVDAEPDITTTQWPRWPVNENKRNVVFFALEIDPVTNRYLGIRFNDYGVGTLSASGEEDPALSALTGMSSTLPPFSNGFNMSFDLRGLVTGSRTAADLYVERVRVSGRKI